ncbi:MAG TPA: cell division protein FtsI, partial [Verrucomicrobiales bacterium]|nr:cell division protein FtsI [Verrucomicrobiales bacterium]
RVFQPRLVKQVQTINEIVVDATEEKKVRRELMLNPEFRETILKGMVAVVSGSGGTGRSAAIPQAQVAGKT